MNNTRKNPSSYENGFFLVGRGGFEPPKSSTADLQSAPFGHSGTYPYYIQKNGAGGRTRTPDLLITNQLLYQLSYTSVLTLGYNTIPNTNSQEFFETFLKKFVFFCFFGILIDKYITIIDGDC